MEVESGEETAGLPGGFSSLRACAETYSDSLPLSSSTGAAALKAPVVYREELNVWHQGENWGTVFPETELLAEAIAPLLSPPLTEPQSVVGIISETPSTWLTLFALPW